jgi:hypothetical protein
MLGVVLAISALYALDQRAYGFCFTPELKVSDEFYVSNLVLSGTVVGSRDIIDPIDPGYTTGTFYWVRVDKYIRGKGPTVVRVYSENTTARFPMDMSQHYVLFLTKDTENHWIVNNCGNSAGLSRDAPTMKSLQHLPLRQSFIHGDVYNYGVKEPCSDMHLTLLMGEFKTTSSVGRDCSFRVTVPPGRYEASLMLNGEKIAPDSLNYKDTYCFVVPVGGSTGIAFRTVDGADTMNKEFIARVDRKYKDLCKDGKIPRDALFLP